MLGSVKASLSALVLFVRDGRPSEAILPYEASP